MTSRQRWRPGQVPPWWAEVVLVLGLYAVYDVIRGLGRPTEVIAQHNAWQIVDVERALSVAIEEPLNRGLASLPALAVPACFFYATLHFILTPLTLVWLYRRHPAVYNRERMWIVIATATALIGFWLLPVAPPRLLPGVGSVDVMAEFASWGWWQGDGSSASKAIANEYAAMPSLHFAWSLWVGLVVARYARHRVVRVLGIAYPVATALVVLGTGNHYLLDVAAGGALLGVAWLATRAIWPDEVVARALEIERGGVVAPPSSPE
ncbi:phosphatase PAP2 family protein [Luteimicrobium subarcticum]|uniref:phosphatase PAP2 family protein n=1 Tax=Luteimicrobium subarcticum TaxID=620910 RepID=UPI0012FE1D4B|nr:phosphatase PAP2 family protein [Luteimicrobium subarcticum]